MGKYSEFYSHDMPEPDDDKIPEIRIKLWLNSDTDNDQIVELMKRIHGLLEREGFTKPDPKEADDFLTNIFSLHAVDMPDDAAELVDTMKSDDSLMMILVETPSGKISN